MPTGMFPQLNFGLSYACQLEACTWLKHSIRKGYCCGDSENLSGIINMPELSETNIYKVPVSFSCHLCYARSLTIRLQFALWW